MTLEEISAAENSWKEPKDISDRHYITKRARPLLMLHVLNLLVRDKKEVNPTAVPSVVAWGIAFPESSYETTEVTYVVNTTWWAENYGTTEDDADED